MQTNPTYYNYSDFTATISVPDHLLPEQHGIRTALQNSYPHIKILREKGAELMCIQVSTPRRFTKELAMAHLDSLDEILKRWFGQKMPVATQRKSA